MLSYFGGYYTRASTRFQIEQSISNAAYIHYLTLYFYKLGYCARPIPVLVKKQWLVTK